eukprot:2794240-Pyramimonas_sp.AAC.1
MTMQRQPPGTSRARAGPARRRAMRGRLPLRSHPAQAGWPRARPRQPGRRYCCSSVAKYSPIHAAPNARVDNLAPR